ILGFAALCSWAVAHGASPKWRLLFRVMCHGLERRCLELFAVPMPICARCTGIYAGLILGLAAFPLIRMLQEKVMRAVAFIAVTPLALDGLTQLTGMRESTNELRIATGVIAGLAFGLWVLSAVERRGEAMLTNS
ncbi:MAG TPA: DUF2085 domain-containing protein, partial [Thermoanaerobaculia bacterium]